jgi:hypothetical protein
LNVLNFRNRVSTASRRLHADVRLLAKVSRDNRRSKPAESHQLFRQKSVDLYKSTFLGVDGNSRLVGCVDAALQLDSSQLSWQVEFRRVDSFEFDRIGSGDMIRASLPSERTEYQEA